MLPGLRLVLVAIAAATILVVVLGFAQLVKLQVAQSQSANLTPVEARFAGLAFAARADWMPISAFRGRSLEALAPFAGISMVQPLPDQVAPDAAEPAKTAALQEVRAAEPAPAADRAPAALTAIPGATAPEAAETATGGLGAAADAPWIDLTALPPPPAAPTPAVPAPAEAIVGGTEVAADPSKPSLSDDARALPEPRPVIASLSGETVPLPGPRPVAPAAPPQSKVQRPAPKKKAARPPTARKRTRPATGAQPAAGAASSNPFAALFGGSKTASAPRK
jgi:hypothetical protein